MRDGLTSGWTITSLGDVCNKPQYGWTCRASKIGNVKYVRTSDISNGQIDWSTVPYCEEVPEDIEKYRVHPDDILVARAGSVGVSYRIAKVHCDAVFASYLIRFNALDGIEPKYVEWFLKSKDYWQAISDFTAGIAIPNVNASKLSALQLPLAPLNEQRRIVAKLEALLGKVDVCQKRLAKIPVLLKRFRQAVLAAAVSGELTKDWREKQLLKESEDGLPASWRRDRFINFILLQRGYDLPIKNRKNGKYPIVTSAGIIEYHAEYRAKGPGVVTGRSGSVGRVHYVDEDYWPHNTVLFVKDFRGNLPRFVYFFLLNFDIQSFSSSTAVPTLNRNTLSNEEVIIPPLEEQQEIVRRVEALFALADRIEARYHKAKSHVEKLTQSILAKAFRGELAPQDPNDEPAEKLLERIKSDREKKHAFSSKSAQ